MKFFYKSRVAKLLRKQNVNHTVVTEMNESVYKHTITVYAKDKRFMLITETQERGSLFGPSNIKFGLVHLTYTHVATKRAFYSAEDAASYAIRQVQTKEK